VPNVAIAAEAAEWTAGIAQVTAQTYAPAPRVIWQWHVHDACLQSLGGGA